MSSNPDDWEKWYKELEDEEEQLLGEKSIQNDIVFESDVSVVEVNEIENYEAVNLLASTDKSIDEIGNDAVDNIIISESPDRNVQTEPDDSNIVINIDQDHDVQKEPEDYNTTGGSGCHTVETPTKRHADSQTIELDTSTTSIEDTPPRKRARFANPDNWKKNIRKNRRAAGLSYVSVNGEIHPEKILNPIPNCTCIYKCSKSFTIPEQQSLFDEYKQYKDVTRQKDFINALVKQNPVIRSRKRDPESCINKLFSREYRLPDKDGDLVRVCKKFFCNTLGTTPDIVKSAMECKSPQGSYRGRDRRKGRPASNATSERDVKAVVKFLSEFPKIPSHYCRARSNRLYFSPELSITKLYELYCEKAGSNAVKDHVFRRIFHEQDPALSVFIPKKDQCSTCNKAEREGTKTTCPIYKEHDLRKKSINEMKAKDKAEANKNKNTMIYATFDLEAILLLPYAGDSQIYYKRKLALHNFTVFDNRSKGACFTWDETAGKKGSAEIGACLIKYIEELPSNIRHVVFYCDTCGGQNRNKNIMAALLYIVNKNKTELRTIDLKFMESGHSYLEADSMHATISRACKNKCIYLPNDYRLIMKMCRKKPFPYDVYELKYNDVFNLELLTKNTIANRNKTVAKKTVNWLNVKWFNFQKGSNLVGFKYDVTAPEFEYINVTKNANIDWNTIDLKPKYSTSISISMMKKKDLMGMIQTGVIPKQYSSFYENLSASKAIRDEPLWEEDFNPDEPTEQEN